MARQQIVVMTDDLDGGDAETTISFGFDGLAYEIDLSGVNAQTFRETMGKYLTAGTRKGKMVLGLHPNSPHHGTRSDLAPTATGRADNRKIREWANARGYSLADRGRIPAHIVHAYQNRGSVPEVQDALPEMPEVLKADPEVIDAASKPAKAPTIPRRQAATKRRASAR